MSKSNTHENDYLKLIYNAVAIADLAENDTSSPLASLYLALHTADPGEAGTQSTNEIAYTGYARKAIARSAAGFTVTGNVVTLVADQDFGEMTAGAGGTVTHFSIGTLASGAGIIIHSGPCTPNQVVANGVVPRVKAATNITED